MFSMHDRLYVVEESNYIQDVCNIMTISEESKTVFVHVE